MVVGPTETTVQPTVAKRKAGRLPGGIITINYIAASPSLAKGISMYEAGGTKSQSLHDFVVGVSSPEQESLPEKPEIGGAVNYPRSRISSMT